MNIAKLKGKVKDYLFRLKYFFIKYRNKKDNDLLNRLYTDNLIEKIKASKECVLITYDGKILTNPKVFKSPKGREYIVATRRNIYGYWFVYFINKYGKIHATKFSKSWIDIQYEIYNRKDNHPGSEYDDCHSLPLKYCNFRDLMNDIPELNVKYYNCLELNIQYIRKTLSDNKE